MKCSKLAIAALAIVMLAGCEGIGHIEPANDQAQKLGGDIAAHFTTVSTGQGNIQAVGYGGEVLKGNYGPVQGDNPFGSIFKEVYGPYSTNPITDNGAPTVAKLTGSKGTTLNCEFYNNDRSNNGYGACKSVTGALYKLHY